MMFVIDASLVFRTIFRKIIGIIFGEIFRVD